MSKQFQILTMGSVALIVSAGAMAAAPSSPVSALSGHTDLSYAIDNTGGLAFTNGVLSSATSSVCSQAGVTCTAMDGSGTEGMIQYLVHDSNATDPKMANHIEMIVGTNDDAVGGDGLFLSDTFVNYGGATSQNSMANKMVIADPTSYDHTSLALLSTVPTNGFELTSEWLRGDYQTFQPNAYNNAVAPNGGTSGATLTRMDSIVDMTIGGTQTFHAEGQGGENGDFSIGGLVDIQQGTNASNTAAGAGDAAAMGVFHTITQGGTSATAGPINYSIGGTPVTVSLGGNTLTIPANGGVTATYIGQDGTTMGFNGSSTDNYTTDDPTKRQFAYINIHAISPTAGGGFPGIALGAPQDPEIGELASVGHLVDTSQITEAGSAVASVYEATTAANKAGAQTGMDSENLSASAGETNFDATGQAGSFTAANATAIQNAWSSIFGSAP